MTAALALIAIGLLLLLGLACRKVVEARDETADVLDALSCAEADLLRERISARANRALADHRDDVTQQVWGLVVQARLERDDAHTSLNLVLAELARRERAAVKFAAPTLAAAVLERKVAI